MISANTGASDVIFKSLWLGLVASVLVNVRFQRFVMFTCSVFGFVRAEFAFNVTSSK